MKNKLISNAPLHSLEGLVLILVYAMSFVFSDSIKNGISDSLSLCSRIIIPSVFPIMVISNTLFLFGLPPVIKKTVAVPSKLFFGLEGDGAVCMIFALTGGFPVGVKNARLLFEAGKISFEEARRISYIGVSPGLSFSIAVCGAFFSSAKTGIIFFLSCLLANLTLGLIMKLFFGTPKKTNVSSTSECGKSLIDCFCKATDKSTSAVISVCAYILVFSAVSALLGKALPGGLSSFFRLTGEVTAGVQFAASEKNRILASFLCGFGGLSVFAQLLSDITFFRIPPLGFLACRFFNGCLAAVYEMLLSKIFMLSELASSFETKPLYSNSFSASLFLFGAVMLMIISSLERRNTVFYEKRS